ncbi:Chorismate mutase 2 [Dichanthelium oligosanthes]|uniref:chorismate mutase n=1 Tax=Dichanthelium oligosanthes TaxID=888268 RepID=A0A1E5VMB5_9POAL|nr:Chorismate mutase 2 [Dichanthelium oligosanthes]
MDAAGGEQLSLAAVRDALVRLEDSVVFALLERARHPRNAPAYAPGCGGGRSLAEFFVREAEALNAKASFFHSIHASLLRLAPEISLTITIQEDVPFFPQDLPSPLFPTKSPPKVLHPLASMVTVNDAIWKMYFDELLPLLTVDGDDGNYAETVALDFACLQVMSRRIHIGKYVAEVKFKDAPQDYSPLIQAKDSNSLMDLLTFKAVEEKVKKRVEKKARTFGQNVNLEDNAGKQEGTAGDSECKVDPTVLSKLYDQWVMPLTKDVEVEYLLRRLD